MGNRLFFLPQNRGYILFPGSVLRHMYGYAQTRFFHKEAGGQLFSATPHEPRIVVESVTGPNPGDIRKRRAFVPNPHQATRDREIQFSMGRHVVGLWHTHPEISPSPSLLDHATIKDLLSDFQGTMTGFILVTLGNGGTPLDMAVWLAEIEVEGTWVPLRESA